jgi:uncharacterized membrane protein YsdA (DUF1294 family)
VAVLAVLTLTLVLEIRDQTPAAQEVYRAADRGLLVSAILILSVGLTVWGAKATLMAMALLLLVPVYSGLKVWARVGEG